MLNNILIEHIKRKLPENIKLYKYLMDVLLIGKEPAYRRIRGQVPFTFDEVTKIAHDLGLSIDSIIQQKVAQNNVSQFFLQYYEKNLSIEAIYLKYLEGCINAVKQILSYPNCKITMGINRVPWAYLPFPNLAKFDYFRFLHAYNQLDINACFSNIEHSAKIADLQKILAYYILKLQNIECICDQAIINKVVEEIKYYYQTALLAKEDVVLLQKELFYFIDNMFKLTDNNIMQKNNFLLYVCNLSIDTNICVYELDDETMSQYWIYLDNPLIVKNNPYIAEINDRWINSRKKYATLISHSNEFDFRKQYLYSTNLIESLNEIVQ